MPRDRCRRGGQWRQNPLPPRRRSSLSITCRPGAAASARSVRGREWIRELLPDPSYHRSSGFRSGFPSGFRSDREGLACSRARPAPPPPPPGTPRSPPSWPQSYAGAVSEQGVGITIRLCREVDRRSVGGGPDSAPFRLPWPRNPRDLLLPRCGPRRRIRRGRAPTAVTRAAAGPASHARTEAAAGFASFCPEDCPPRGAASKLWAGRMWRGPDGCVLDVSGGQGSGGFGACRRDSAKDVAAGSTSLALDRRRARPPPLSRLRLRRPRRLRRRRSRGVARISRRRRDADLAVVAVCRPGGGSAPAPIARIHCWATERTSFRAGPAASAGGTRTAFPSEPRPRVSATTRSSIVVAGPTELRDSRMLQELTSRLRSLPLRESFLPGRRGANECARPSAAPDIGGSHMVIRAALMAIMVAGGPTPSVLSAPPPAPLPGPAAPPASSPGSASREMPLPIAVRGAQDLTFKTESTAST